MKYAVICEKSAPDYSANEPDKPGRIAACVTLAKTVDLMRGAIALHLETMLEDGDAIPEATTVANYIAVPV